MSHLLDPQMLLTIRRRVPQVKDLLQAEDKYLDVIIDYIAWLRERTILLRAEVMNIPNLKKKIKQITDLDCEIKEDNDEFTFYIRYYLDAQEPVFEFEKAVFAYIPAHLKVISEYLQAYSGSTKNYKGTAQVHIVRYHAKPVEVNKKKEGTAEAKLAGSGFYYTKIIGYSKEMNDGK